MSNTPTVDQALGWITEQVGGLSRLRNANPRSSEFKQWRQAALLVVQRIWPNDPLRSDRFRRVPFSPSSARSDDKVAREAYERGCSEARRLLRMWITEIKHHGITASEAVVPPGEGDETSENTDNPVGKQRLKEMLGLAPPLPEPPVVAVPDARDPSPSAVEARDPAPREPDDLANLLGRSIADALELAKLEDPRAPAPAGPPPEPRSVHPGVPHRVESPGSAAARDLAGLASELHLLDVPASERDRVDFALVRLAGQLDAGDLTWTTLRETMAMVMEFPALARRVMPVLLPFFEAAA